MAGPGKGVEPSPDLPLSGGRLTTRPARWSVQHDTIYNNPSVHATISKPLAHAVRRSVHDFLEIEFNFRSAFDLPINLLC